MTGSKAVCRLACSKLLFSVSSEEVSHNGVYCVHLSVGRSFRSFVCSLRTGVQPTLDPNT